MLLSLCTPAPSPLKKVEVLVHGNATPSEATGFGKLLVEAMASSAHSQLQGGLKGVLPLYASRPASHPRVAELPSGAAGCALRTKGQNPDDTNSGLEVTHPFRALPF